MQILIENVNILNPNEEIKTACQVLIENKYIKQITSGKIATKHNVEVIDGDDNYLMPGFIDCHCHIMANDFTKKKIWQIL